MIGHWKGHCTVYRHKNICVYRKEFGHGNPVHVGFPSHCEALAEQWGEFVVSRRARAGTLVFLKTVSALTFVQETQVMKCSIDIESHPF